MSYAMLKNARDTKGLWSVARGLARNEAEYKRHLAACDQPRRGDRDGRGTLSEAALADFTAFFLKICIDQIHFMEGLMKPDRLRDRILIWAEEEMRAGTLPAKSDTVLRAVLMQGSITRADVVSLLGVGALQLGIPCSVCGGPGLYWDEQTQDVETCDDCERLVAFFRSQEEPEPKSNVIYLRRNPYTGKLDDIPF